MNMCYFWADYAQIVKVLKFFIWESVLKSALQQLFSMDILVSNVHKQRYGMEPIASTDVVEEKYGSMLTVSVQQI